MQAATPQLTPQPARIESIDILRGLTILVMVFVNDVSGVKGLPWWTYHMPSETNGMTYVDMVFPTFLFMVGTSIPLAFERRISRGDSDATLWTHVVLRSLGLVTLGLVLANMGRVDPAFTGLGRTTWRLLAFAGILLVWNVYPRSERRTWMVRAARCAGLALLLWLLIIYRRRDNGHAAWLDLSYWEILGLIGWAYLSSSILYLLLRTRPWALAVSLVALNALNVACAAGWLNWPGRLPDYVWPFETGALASVVMAGVLASIILAKATRNRALLICGYGLILFVCGLAEIPLGVSKNHGTPAWCLLSSAAATFLFAVLYWVADVRHVTRWATFVKPAGSNTLTTYLLPWMWYSIPAFNKVPERWETGVAGVVKALCFTAVILGLSAVLTRLKVRLQL